MADVPATPPVPDPVADKAAALKVLTDDRQKRLERFQALTAEAIKSCGFAYAAEPTPYVGQDGVLRWSARVIVVEASE